jgi:protein-S-isoprenylcysteine O-methyltransferase Ste14
MTKFLAATNFEIQIFGEPLDHIEESVRQQQRMIKLSLHCNIAALWLLLVWTAISLSEAAFVARPQRVWLTTRYPSSAAIASSWNHPQDHDIKRQHSLSLFESSSSSSSSTEPTNTYEYYYATNPAVQTTISTDVVTGVAPMATSTTTTTAGYLQPYHAHAYPTAHNDVDHRDDVMDKFQASWNQWMLSSQQALPDVASLSEHAPQIATNIVSGGDLGDRGEIFVVLQVALVAALAMGSAALPYYIGVPLELLLGPIVMVMGAMVGLYASIELGPCLSPWPVPANIFEELVVTGVYARVRHPLYAGLLAIAVGYAVATHSAVRLLLTVALWYILDRQADYEEDQLQDIYPEYRTYRRQVTGKFWPQKLFQWSLSYPPDTSTTTTTTTMRNGDRKGTLPSRDDRQRGVRAE